MRSFDKEELKQLYRPPNDSSGEQNGQVTIIGGSKLFHGAPILSLTAASRIVDMVFFASPNPSIGEIASQIKAQLSSFIWVPWAEVESYISKSDAVLIGPGFMRYSNESEIKNHKLGTNDLDVAGRETYEITKHLLTKFPDKKWVIDAGSLQVIDPEYLPKDSIITPNKHEFEMLFGDEIEKILHKVLASQNSNSLQDDTSGLNSLPDVSKVENIAKKYSCTIVYKGPEAIVSNGDETIVVNGGNAGLTKGGTGDTLAGLTVALLAKNDPMLAACAATFVLKKTAEELEKIVGTNFNADDLANAIFPTFKRLVTSKN